MKPNRIAGNVKRSRAEGGAVVLHPSPNGSRRPAARAAVDIPKRERRSYSIAAAILQEAGDMEPGYETEVSQELGKQLESRRPSELASKAAGERGNGILVPTLLDRHRKPLATVLETGTATLGQESVFTQFGGFLPLLRNRAMVIQLGADVIPGLRGNVQFVKQTGAVTAVWVDETPGSDVADTNLTLDTVVLSPKTLQASTHYSRQLLRQAHPSVSADDRVETDLAKIHGLGLDLAALHGAGGGTEPEGLYVATGVNEVAFGGSVSFAKMVEMETAIAADNADVDNMAYLATPEVRGAGKTTEKFTSSDGRPVWTGSADDGEVNGYRAAVTNQLRKDLGVGSDEHGCVFGDWSQLMIGEWGVLELITDPYRLKKQGIIEVTSFHMVDIQLRYPEAFAKGTGLIP